MRVLVGTSGYQYRAWRGPFYDERCKERDMLAAYSRALPTVEVNNTFYRMPKAEVLAKWAGQVPAEFRFAIKAPKRITHVLRLRNTADTVRYLFKNLEQLGDKLGCVLFQLPPFFRKDAERLRGFLKSLPAGARVSFEFRHESWDDAEVVDLLCERGAAWCVADMLDPVPELRPTAAFGYLRLRREVYSDEELSALRERLGVQPWREVYVYFKDEDDAPALANRLSTLFERQGPGLAKATDQSARTAGSKVAS
jgi:uncharacterized protein YecE (DUF72 family)